MAAMNQLFKSFGVTDEDKQKKLKDLLDGIKGRADMSIASPQAQPSADITPRPMEAMPQAPVQQTGPGTPNWGVLPSSTDQPPTAPIATPIAAPNPVASPAVSPETDTEDQMFRGYGGADQSRQAPPGLDQLPSGTPIQAPAGYDPQPPKQYSNDSAGTSQQIQDLKGYHDPHKHSLLGRLFKGIAKGYQHWDGQGGLLGLGAATLGSGIGAAASPKIYENLERQTRQDTLFKQLGLQQQQETYNSKQGLIDAQTGNYQSEVANRNLQGILNIDKNKRDNFNDDPDIFQIKNTKRITKEQANRLNAKYGSNLTPSAWVAYVEKIDPVTGASIIRPDDDPRYSTNPTVGADLSKKVVPVNINGIDTAMTGTDLAHAQIAEAGANASRQAQTELHNSTQAFEAARTNAAARTANMKAIADNNKAKVTQSAGNLTNLSEVQALNGNMARIAEQMQQKTDDLNNPKLDKEATQKAIDKLNEDFNTASTKFGEALGKTNGGIALQTELNSFVPPAVEMVNAKPITPVHTDYIRPTTPPPGTSKGGKNNNIATPDAYRKALKRVGGR